jgi:hypothetical protein
VQQFAEFEHRDEHESNGFPDDHGLSVTSYDDRRRRHEPEIADTTPANTARTDGPDSIHDNGIHLHFLVNGSPTDVMSAYKTAIQGKSWSLIVDSSSGGGGGGGATYTASNGNTFGVFTGGGYGGMTDVDACAWPSQPANTDCGHGNG